MILAKKGHVPWNKGKTGIYSEETKRKISRKGSKQSEETKRKISLAGIGRKHTEEAKRKIGKGNIGNIHTKETKKKMSVAKKGKKPWNKGKTGIFTGTKNPFYGKHHSEETKRFLSERVISKETKKKMSVAKKGKKLSIEHSRKIALGNTGKKRTEEVKKKASERMMGERNPWRGKHHSEETKKKLSELNKGEKNAFFGKTHTEESKRKQSDKMRGRYQGKDNPFFGQTHTEGAKKIMSDASFLRKDGPWRDTWGEKELGNILTANEIQFVAQKYFRLARHRVDIFIEPNICIEVDGDYFHANPHPYPLRSSIHPGHKPDEIIRGGKTAEEKWERDRRQTEALEQQCKQVVIRFYQSELETEPEKCLQKIIKIIKESRR